MKAPLLYVTNVAGLLLLLAGCAVGPNYQRPSINPPASFGPVRVARLGGGVVVDRVRATNTGHGILYGVANDRVSVLERTREVFRRFRGVRIDAIGPNIRMENGRGYWRANIRVDSEDNSELMSELKGRVNSLQTPFELEWRHVSGKPWDWKLVAVRNSELEMPTGY